MTHTNVQSAQVNLAQLIEKAIAGEDVFIEVDDTHQVKIVAVPIKKDWLGMDKGKIVMADDFDELPADLLTAFYGENNK